jgi:O-antigen/teichoic acid export membrane protein
MVNSLKNKLTSLVPANAFARGVGVLVGGTVGAQALMVLVSPILTRLYSPDDFGLLAVYGSILIFFTVISSLRYEIAIPIPERKCEALNLVKICIVLVIITSSISIFFVYLFGGHLATVVGKPRLETYLWLLPIGIATIGLYNIFNYWNLRNKNYKTIAKTKFTQSIASIVVQLSCFKLGALALILGQVVGQAFGTSALSKKIISSKDFKIWDAGDLKNTAIKYKKFPIFSTWEGLINAAGSQLPPLLFALFFSASAAGFYMLAHKVLAMPMALIGGAVANVFLTNAAYAYRNDELHKIFEPVYTKLVYIVMPLMLVLIVDAPALFSLVFGKDWEYAGEIARWMTPWLSTVFIASPLSTLFSIVDKQKQGMYFQIIMLFFRLIGILIGFYYQNLILAIASFSILSMLCWLGFLVWACRISNSKPLFMIKKAVNAFTISIMIVSPLIVNKILNLDILYWFLALGLTSIAITIHYLKLLTGSSK